jgi:hypothetical protein
LSGQTHDACGDEHIAALQGASASNCHGLLCHFPASSFD